MASVREFSQQETIDTFQWPAIPLDMNVIEHVWDFVGRKVNQHNPQCQNIAELTNTILELEAPRSLYSSPGYNNNISQ